MLSLKGTKTEENLLKSFAGESQARNRYSYFASVASKEGYGQIADIFEETSNQEKAHAKRFFKFLEGGDLKIMASFPSGKIGTTAENLLASAMGEHEEHSDLYPSFAAIAKEEGFSQIAAVWGFISVAEKQHEKRYRDLLANLESGRVFKRNEESVWRCRKCGYVHSGKEAPRCARLVPTHRGTSSCWVRTGRTACKRKNRRLPVRRTGKSRAFAKKCRNQFDPLSGPWEEQGKTKNLEFTIFSGLETSRGSHTRATSPLSHGYRPM